MSNCQKKYSKGVVTTLVLVFGSIFAIILAGLSGYIVMQYRINQRITAKEQALHIAESGIEYYNWYLAHALEGLSEQEQNQFWNENQTIGYPDAYQDDFKDQYGSTIGYYLLEITPPLPGGNTVTVKSTGWTTDYPQIKRVVQIRRRRPSWSEYIILVNHRANIAEGTTLRGKVHSNEDLRVDGIVYNLATASETTHPDPITEEEVEPGVWTTKDPPDVFLGGREDGVPIIDFNILAGQLNTLKSETEGTDYYLDPPIKQCWPSNWFCLINTWNPSGYIVELKNDSTIDIYKTTGFSIFGFFLPIFTSTTLLGNYPWPSGRLIFSEATVWVKGDVGPNQITIGAANLLGVELPGANNLADIIIQDDITYSNSEAVVGLIAQDNIMIDRDAGDPDLDINAAMIAKEGQVGREDFGDNLGTLTINGSIATNYLGEFGGQYCFYSWCWVAGFQAVNLNYDSNLFYIPPPYFPTEEDYQTDMWEEIE